MFKVTIAERIILVVILGVFFYVLQVPSYGVVLAGVVTHQVFDYAIGKWRGIL